MDSGKKTINSNPRQKANFISIILWTWTIKIFKLGYSKDLEAEDLYDPLKSDCSNVLGDRLEKQWNLELKNAKISKRSPNFLKTIFRCFKWEYIFYGTIHSLNEFILRLGTPLLLGRLLRYFRKTGDVEYSDALMYASGICLGIAINAITINYALFGAFYIGGRVRIAVCSLIYRKALKLSTNALGETAPGKIVNLVASDVNRFDIVSVCLHYLWSAPLVAIIIGYFLYMEAGYAGVFGIVAVFTVVPIQSYTGKLTSKFRLQTAIKTDERVRLMDEIISGVLVIKMYAWEKPFCSMVALARKLELKVVQKSSWIRGIYMTFNLFTTRMAIYCTLIGMLFFGQQITAEKAFVFMSYFNILSHTMSGMFVRGIAEVSECLVAVRRLQYFLMYDEFHYGDHTNSLDDKANISNTDAESNLKIDVSYIDNDNSNESQNHNGTEGLKQNGLAIVASDLVKNTADVFAGQVNSNNESSMWAVKLNNLTAKWESSNPENTLQNININIEQGKIYAIIGAVGSGKSSLISAILGEIPITNGHVNIEGKLSYASQDSWVFGSSVRQNILFGTSYDRQRYHKVVKVCALLNDFKQFPHGDQTIVGERGSSLSGGQKARVNLARAVYRQVQIYMFDDPLSAVDTHVGKHLFDECIKRYLSGKTRIIVTHQLQYIKNVDGIILVEHGSARQFKTYHDLLSQCPEYSELFMTESVIESGDDSSHEKDSILRKISITSITRNRTPEVSGSETDIEEEDDNNEVQKNVEATSRGVIEGSIFMKYFRSSSSWCFISTVGIFFILSQFAASVNDYFIQIFINEEESRNLKFLQSNVTYNTLNYNEQSTNNSTPRTLYKNNISPALSYVYIYSIIVLSIFFIGMTRSFLFYALCIRNSQKLHDRSFRGLIRTGMKFFDTNPSGRILNRFSKDIGAIDELLPKALLDAGQLILMMIGSVTIVCIINPIFLIPLVIIAFISYWIRKIYLKTSKNVKRLEGMMKSPVFTHLNATLNGLPTIRAYGAQTILKEEFDKFQDTHSSAWYIFIVTSTAFGFSMDVFCVIFVTIVTFSFLTMNITGAEVGLAISTIMSMTGMIQWGLRQSAEVANQLMSVERVLEYALLPPEKNSPNDDECVKTYRENKDNNCNNDDDDDDDDNGQFKIQVPIHPPTDWPSEGCIIFNRVYMRYVDDELPVLKDLNIIIKPAEKVGIVGRTGAGKSSIIASLFRLAKVEGIIKIDGIDTGTIFIDDLRRNISIIPQDPILFSGTLRKNLDPFAEFTDEELWTVLEEVELKSAVVGLNGLDSRVFDRGTNFSAGQRQLVCLARAILRNNKILMLDEATANVDPHTDGLIQRTIRNKFAKCTVLTVAHRLNTIMDCDKVLVMDKGRMVEYDHPYILLKNDRGVFTSLVNETGRTMRDQLYRISSNTYHAKHHDQLTDY